MKVMKIETAIISAMMIVTAYASVPLKWTVETSRVQPAVFEVVRGETLALEATLQSYGKPLSMAGKTCSLFYQTNGMDNAWWTAQASASSNNVTATFTPRMDPGANVINGFIGTTGDIYRAAFTLRFRPGPGSSPNVISRPPQILDLANTTVINAPWPTDDTIFETVRQVVDERGITAGTDSNTVTQIVRSELNNPENELLKANTQIEVDQLIVGNSSAGVYILTDGSIGTQDGSSLKCNGEEIAVKSDIPTDDITTSLAYARGVYNYMNANTNAWFAGTNYVVGADSGSRHKFAFETGMDLTTVPCSMALMERRDGQKSSVWDQRDWVSWYWTFKRQQMMGEIATSNAAIYAAIDAPANHAWAKRFAATGRVNPDANVTYVDTKSVCLAPGMNWETVATVGGCGYWTIVGNGAVIGGVGTNATLQIKDFEGNEIMTITKGEHRLAWLESSDFVGQSTDDDGWVCFDVRSDVQPVGYFSTTLDSSDFVAEGEDGCPAQYRWEDIGSGKFRIHFLLKSGIVSSGCFAKFQYEVQGATQVKYNAGIVIEGGLIYNGKKIAPVVPSNAAVGDTITWKVVR